jgi:hypothetical protein
MNRFLPQNLDPKSSEGSLAAAVLFREEPDEEEDEQDEDDEQDDGDEEDDEGYSE